MAKITVNEISKNYAYNLNKPTFCTVALPITSAWGPGYVDPETLGKEKDEVLDDTVWEQFAATSAGLEQFVSTYRGPATDYRIRKDYSYQLAMTLLVAGYDVLVCRMVPGSFATKSFTVVDNKANRGTLSLRSKYAGSFANRVAIKFVPCKFVEEKPTYYNMIVYVVQEAGGMKAVENFRVTLNDQDGDYTFIENIESEFVTAEVTLETGLGNVPTGAFIVSGDGDVATAEARSFTYTFENGSDCTSAEITMDKVIELAKKRFKDVCSDNCFYLTQLNKVKDAGNISSEKMAGIYAREWIFNEVRDVYALLEDKFAYSPRRIISPGWDDIDTEYLTEEKLNILDENSNVEDNVSPLHLAIMNTCYHSRCAAGLLDIPKALPRSQVSIDSDDSASVGYVQALAAAAVSDKVVAFYEEETDALDENRSLYTTHAAMFAPWGQYKLVGMSSKVSVPPSFLALMIQIATIRNQTVQYEWVLPSNRDHDLDIGKLDYKVPHKLLNQWQDQQGVDLNVITTMPDLGTIVWGNSTMFDLPEATYQALANLSTRYLFNAIKDVVYRVGCGIVYTWNNAQAQSSFVTGVSPILDQMKTAGAIEDYYIRASKDIDVDGQVQQNSLLGFIYIKPYGIVNELTVDLVALPAGSDLGQFKA